MFLKTVTLLTLLLNFRLQNLTTHYRLLLSIRMQAEVQDIVCRNRPSW